MFRWIAAALSTLLLSGCVTTEYVYRDRYHDSGYAADGYYESRRYSGSGTYYSPSYGDRGDYYYRQPQSSYYGYDDYPSWYWDYPSYYSLFWPMYRSWYDPYWHPHFYYGVTYYPRNYFSISFHSGWGWPRYGHQYYSPYRYSWVDNYYDWRPWYGSHYYYGRHSRYYSPAPRYGSARNEAERLSRLSDFSGYGAQADGRYGPARRETAFGTYGTTRSGARGADYTGRPAPRQDPGVRGFGVQGDGYRSDVRRNASYGPSRQDPGVGGFGTGSDRGDSRGADYGSPRSRAQPPAAGFGSMPEATSPREYSRESRYGAGREVGRYGDATLPGYSRGTRRVGIDEGTAPRYDRAPAETGLSLPRETAPSYERGYSRRNYDARGYSSEQPIERGYRSPARESFSGSMPEPRSYEPPARGYDAPTRNYEPPERSYEAPSRSYEAPSRSYDAPQSYSAPEPRYESRESPRFESRSDSDNDSGVRRVGSNRDD